MKEVKLPSGAILKITISPFSDSKALYQALLEEFRKIDFKSSTGIPVVLKDVLCAGFSSKKIESCLEQCFKRCIYNDGRGDLKIDATTFEKEESRVDYISVCMAVTKENVAPFMTGLFAEFQQSSQMMESVLA